MGEYDLYKQQVVAAAQGLFTRGYLMATGGNLSVRIPGNNFLAITPSNYDYMLMTAEDVCVLDADLNIVEGHLKPSVESGMHAAIYASRADVNAVAHTHQVFASSLSLVNAPIPALFDEQVRFLGRSVEIISYAPSGTGMLANTIARHIKNHHNAYIMRNHGILCFGNTIQRAVDNVEILEKCALAYLLALSTGKPVSKIPLPIREIIFSKLRSEQKKIEKGEPVQSGE